MPAAIVSTVGLGDGPPRPFGELEEGRLGARRHRFGDGRRRRGWCRTAAGGGGAALSLRGCVGTVVVRGGVPASTVGGWLRRLGGERAERWRRVLMGVLGVLDARVRPVEPDGGVAGGGRLGEALAVLGAVAAAVRRRGVALAMVTDQQVASHLSRGLLLAPSGALVSINTSPFLVPA